MTGLRVVAAVLLAIGAATLASGQVPPPPLPAPITIDMLKLQFSAQSGSDTVYFPGDGHGLDLSAQRTLAAQARWLRANPMISVRIEGHGDDRLTRDHALAVGERRADAVRAFLVLQGVPAAQISTISWGTERPTGNGGASSRAVTMLMPPRF